LRTTDEEREIVLRQNDALREQLINRSDYRVPQGPFRPDTYRRLRRCALCLQGSCADQAACRAEFATWTERIWDAAVRAECAARGKEMDEASIVFTY
jgi:hypothetical protein